MPSIRRGLHLTPGQGWTRDVLYKRATVKEGWRDGSVVKHAYCSFQVQFQGQATHNHLYKTLVPEVLIPTHVTHIKKKNLRKEKPTKNSKRKKKDYQKYKTTN